MRIKELREYRNLTQSQVASAINTSQRNIGRWENGENEPSSSFIIKLADFFGVTSDYLLGRADDFGNLPPSPSALTADEAKLLTLFRSMTGAQQTRVIGFCEGVASENGKD